MVMCCVRIALTAFSMQTTIVGLCLEVRTGLHGSGALNARNGRPSSWTSHSDCRGTLSCHAISINTHVMSFCVIEKNCKYGKVTCDGRKAQEYRADLGYILNETTHDTLKEKMLHCRWAGLRHHRKCPQNRKCPQTQWVLLFKPTEKNACNIIQFWLLQLSQRWLACWLCDIIWTYLKHSSNIEYFFIVMFRCANGFWMFLVLALRFLALALVPNSLFFL